MNTLQFKQMIILCLLVRNIIRFFFYQFMGEANSLQDLA